MTSVRRTCAIAFFAGLLTLCAVGIVRQGQGRPVTWAEAGLMLLWFGAAFGLAGGYVLRRDWNMDADHAKSLWALDEDERRARLPIVTPDQPEPLPTVSPLVGGGLMDEWELHHLQGLLLTLRHASEVGSLTSTSLIGLAFRDYEHWVYWVDILVVSGLADKQNGIPTAIKAGKTWAWAKRQVVNGLFDAPAQYKGSPFPEPPLPFSASLHDKVKLERAGKAGKRFGKDG